MKSTKDIREEAICARFLCGLLAGTLCCVAQIGCGDVSSVDLALRHFSRNSEALGEDVLSLQADGWIDWSKHLVIYYVKNRAPNVVKCNFSVSVEVVGAEDENLRGVLAEYRSDDFIYPDQSQRLEFNLQEKYDFYREEWGQELLLVDWEPAIQESSCSLVEPETCGDGTINQSWEECDGNELGNKTCTSFGYDGGRLECKDCEYDTSNCVQDPNCGDGTVNQSWEECDGNDLANKTCTSFGYDGGELECKDCNYDTSNCYHNPKCGDGIINQSWEECDGGDHCSADCRLIGPAPPPNDQWQNAIALDVSELTPGDEIRRVGTVVGATTAPEAPACPYAIWQYPGVWYKITGYTGRLLVDLCGLVWGEGPISVYKSSYSRLTCIGGQDVSCDEASAFVFEANGTSNYFVRVYPYPDVGETNFELVVKALATP